YCAYASEVNMYCPKCATQNKDDSIYMRIRSFELPPRVVYCRSCGSNLTLVPQALTGRLPTEPSRRMHRRDFERGGPPTLANGISKAFVGVGFLLVSFACFFFAPAGRIWWFWMLLPAFAILGKGIAEIVSAKYQPSLRQGVNQAVPPAPTTGELRPRNDVFIPPASVTEQTTRQLDQRTFSL
ncbi:MAG TPA: hypothetical protein VKN18_12540, partial [Blastocatellia bacterium]|nr:hypothetical protein [Blastocatellia bacterium]